MEAGQSSGLTSVRILLAQLEPHPVAPSENVGLLEETLSLYPEAEIAVFPELFLHGYNLQRLESSGLSIEAEPIQSVREAAGRYGTSVIVGFAEQVSEGLIANSALCVDRNGAVSAIYRKTHLFGSQERSVFAAGELYVAPVVSGVRVGPMICFDMEFPEPARALGGAGADVLLTIAANPKQYSADHLLASRARALDNRRPHVYVNRVGSEAGLQFGGGSRAIDHSGDVIYQAGDEEDVAEVTVKVNTATDPDLQYLNLVRASLPVSRGTSL